LAVTTYRAKKKQGEGGGKKGKSLWCKATNPIKQGKAKTSVKKGTIFEILAGKRKGKGRLVGCPSC